MYRKQDLQYLQDIFDRNSNDIALLYGMRSCGLNRIIFDLAKDKSCLYYKAGAYTDGVQRRFFANEIYDQTKSPIFPDEDYDRLITTFINENSDSKKLIIIDDFIYLIRNNPTFINFIAGLFFHKVPAVRVMLLLACDDIKWVENDMIKVIGKKSSEISGIIKLKGFSPTEFVSSFPDIPLSEAMGIYSVIGRRCALYDGITKDSTTALVITNELEKYMADDFDPSCFLPSDIREPSIYNTILIKIAAGHGKLNDLHKETGIDRAKLSVYLKTLIDSDIVVKAVSANVGDPQNTVKGTYLIEDRLTLFFYRFVLPHFSSLRIIGAERFYKKYIEHELISYMEEYYPIYCMEQVRWLQDHDRLNFKVSSIEKYYDKNGAIDFVVVAAGGSVIACACRYAGPHMSYKTYEDVKAAVRRNKINNDNIWLFSTSGFDQKLAMFGSVTLGVRLIDGVDQRLR